MGIAKATGKAAKVRFIEITKIENGKIKEDWLVFDSLAFATQLGL
jgi:predicted ester cyclase